MTHNDHDDDRLTLQTSPSSTNPMKRRPAKIRKGPDSATKPNLGLAIKILRKEQNLTQEALAALAGDYAGRERLHKQRISEIENGRVGEPHADTLKAIADALHVTVEEIYVKARSLSNDAPGVGPGTPVGRDVVINLSIDGSHFDRNKLAAELNALGLDASPVTALLGGDTVEALARGTITVGSRKLVLKHNLLQAYRDKKYLRLSTVAERVGASLTAIKSHAEQIHHCLGSGDYGTSHQLLKQLLDNPLLPAEHKSGILFDYAQTGYVHYANSGNRSGIRDLYSRIFDYGWRKLEPRLLCLLAEMQQEVATRDLDPGLLEENLESLSRLEDVCRTDPETHEYLTILRALCLRRLGERSEPKRLDESIAIHRKLMGRPTRRFIEISSSFGNALLRRFEATGDVRDLDEAETVLSSVSRPKGEVLISELEAYPRTLNALGNAYRHRMILTCRSEDFTRAIECYTKAEAYWSEDASPYEWAMLQKNKAKATLLFAGTHDVSLEFVQDAIDQARRAIGYRTKKEAPYQHQGLIDILGQLEAARRAIVAREQKGRRRGAPVSKFGATTLPRAKTGEGRPN